MDRKHALLQRYFGYSSFREGQEEVVDAITGGRDAFAVMPTGGGKSICYQLPALMLPGVAVVVSPLISLMKDQVMALSALGVKAAYINSSQTSDEARAVYSGLRRGDHKLIYVAPERLMLDGFISAIRSVDVSLVAVDEAHCISQWGQDFRPSYLRIPDFVSCLDRRPVLAAFTATATPEVRDDVERLLRLSDPCRVTTGFDRPNLRFEVMDPPDKLPALLSFLSGRRDRSGIIYCSTRKNVETLCDRLRARGFAATRYHAGLDDGERRQNQEDFIYDRKPIMVATNAFGMGIDKSNVSFVVHYNMPKSLEEYYQEAGRAGRDGEPADCVLMYGPGDISTAKYLISNSGENPELSDEERRELLLRDTARLQRMIGYCETRGCYRGYILSYFGQPHSDECGNCGNCLVPFSQRDVTRQAQMILSCVGRIHEKLNYYVGQSLVTLVLLGSRSRRVSELGLDTLSTYGLMRGTDKNLMRLMFSRLKELGYIVTDPVHGAVKLTDRARNVLFHGESVVLPVRDVPRSPSKAKEAVRPMDPEDMDDEFNELLSALKVLRLDLARREGVPLYVIFSNATLTEMARRKPKSVAELLEIPGVGTVKAGRFGDEFLRVIRNGGR